MEQAASLDRSLSIKNACIYIDKSETALRKLIDREVIRASKARDGSIRIRLSELDAYLRGDATDQASSNRVELRAVPPLSPA
jgi:hypothetical protein